MKSCTVCRYRAWYYKIPLAVKTGRVYACVRSTSYVILMFVKSNACHWILTSRRTTGQTRRLGCLSLFNPTRSLRHQREEEVSVQCSDDARTASVNNGGATTTGIGGWSSELIELMPMIAVRMTLPSIIRPKTTRSEAYRLEG